MKSILKIVLVLLALATLASCAPKFQSYNGPTITLVEVHKADRMMYLISGDRIIETYKIRLGGNPIGPKQFEGDQKTPEGSYRITHRNPNSAYHLSLGVSYPNDADSAFALANGLTPGGDIFIHGANNNGRSRGDWTVGCIAVTDKQIQQIYAMVNPGTLINIFP